MIDDERAHIGGEPLKLTVRLNVPIKHGDEILTELVLTEPTFEEMEKLARASDADRGRLTMSVITALPPSVIKQLRGRDIGAINKLIPQLLGEDDSQKNGEI